MDFYYTDPRDHALAVERTAQLNEANAKILGLKRVIRKLGIELQRLDPKNEHLTLAKFDEVYMDTELELPSVFK